MLQATTAVTAHGRRGVTKMLKGLPVVVCMQYSVPTVTTPQRTYSTALTPGLSVYRHNHRHTHGAQVRHYSTLQSDFETAVSRSKDTSAPRPDNNTMLQVYALYKQATSGPNTTDKPGMMDFVGKAKWQAWSDLKDMDKETAMKEYIGKINDIQGPPDAPKSASDPAPHVNENEGSGLVTYTTDNGVATVLMHKPAMPPSYFTDLGITFNNIANDPNVRAVVLKSAPGVKAFSYGLDVQTAAMEMGHLFTSNDKNHLLTLIRRWQDDITAIAKCPKPVVAAIHSYCLGGGVDVIAACDIRVSSADAVFSVREAKIGIVADLGSLQRLPPIIGDGHTRELALTACDIDAARAERIGLVNHVAASREETEAKALAIAQEMADNPANAVQGTKQVINYGQGKPIAEQLEYVAAWNSAFLDFQVVASLFKK
eukprot:GFYU01001923.1.p1 GENE.GFYU01001923.1~~GFYU01001923.1.p1  ORF type:complete len:427 (-),score=127.09 GFYU01001923.1:143-1423(-)